VFALNKESSPTYPLLEQMPLLQGQGVRLGNDRNDIDDLCELLQDDDINLLVSYSSRPAESATYRLQGVAGRVDEEETAVDTGVGDVFISESSKLFSQVSRVLVLDLLWSAFGRPTPNPAAGLTCFTMGSQQLSLLIWSP
jgi:hypothetical protein